MSECPSCGRDNLDDARFFSEAAMATDPAAEALAIHEAKGNVTGAARARESLAAARVEIP